MTRERGAPLNKGPTARRVGFVGRIEGGDGDAGVACP